MLQINLATIPNWLSKSIFLKTFYEKLSSSEIGSEEYLKELLEPIEVKYFKETDTINNIKDFYNIMKISKYYIIKYPASIYFYIYQHLEEVLDFLQEKYGKKSDDELLDFIEDIKNGNYFVNNKNDIIWYASQELNLSLEKVNEIKNFHPKYITLPNMTYNIEIKKLENVDNFVIFELNVLLNGFIIGNFSINRTNYIFKLIKELNIFNKDLIKSKLKKKKKIIPVLEFDSYYGPSWDFNSKENIIYIDLERDNSEKMEIEINMKNTTFDNIIDNLKNISIKVGKYISENNIQEEEDEEDEEDGSESD